MGYLVWNIPYQMVCYSCILCQYNSWGLSGRKTLSRITNNQYGQNEALIFDSNENSLL